MIRYWHTSCDYCGKRGHTREYCYRWRNHEINRLMVPVLVRFDWDSQTVAMYSEARPGTAMDLVGRNPHGGSGPVLPVPRELWERYAKAQEELAAAEAALEEARTAAQKVQS